MKEMKNKSKILYLLSFLLLALLFVPMTKAMASTSARLVEVGVTDYERLTMQVIPNDNPIVYYSTNNKTWNEVEGEKGTNLIIMDISWVSATSDSTLYFKGSEETTVNTVELSKRNSTIKVKFNKVDGNLEFSGCDEADSFEWRKSTDYSWTPVKMDEADSTYKSFMKEIEKLRLKGAKIYVRTAQVSGKNSADTGMRSSKEVSVSITKRSNAPSLKVNVLKMTVNTKDSMEYYDESKDKWIECGKNMELKDLMPSVLFENGGNKVTRLIRYMDTATKPYSKTFVLEVDGQKVMPTIGDSTKDVTYYTSNNKFVLQFNKAASEKQFEYTVVKPGVTYNSQKASWKSVRSSKAIQLSASAAPRGSIIYVRQKGVAANTRKNIVLVLPTAMNVITVK